MEKLYQRHQLILDQYTLGFSQEFNNEAFLKEYGIPEAEMPTEVRLFLEEGRSQKNGDFIENGIFLGHRFEFPEDSLELVHNLVLETFHTRHEDLIGLLQDWEAVSSIPILSQAIELKPALDHLSYDDYGAYYKKCLWALTAIGTPDAKRVIESYTHSKIPELQEEAKHRLDRFDECVNWSADRENQKINDQQNRESKRELGWVAFAQIDETSTSHTLTIIIAIFLLCLWLVTRLGYLGSSNAESSTLLLVIMAITMGGRIILTELCIRNNRK